MNTILGEESCSCSSVGSWYWKMYKDGVLKTISGPH